MSWICLNILLALSTIVLVKLILSAMTLISLKALARVLLELSMVLLLIYFGTPDESNPAFPKKR